MLNKTIGVAPVFGDTKDVEIVVLLKYLSNFQKSLEIPLVSSVTLFKISPALTGAAKQEKNTTTYGSVVTDNSKLLQHLKSGFKRKTNRMQISIKSRNRSQALCFLSDLRFQEINKFFVLSFKILAVRTGHTEYYLTIVKIKYDKCPD